MVKEDSSSVEVDPCTGFPVTHKAKLSIPTIIWTKYGKNGVSSEASLGEVGGAASSKISPLYEEIKRNKLLRYLGLVLTLLSAITFSFNVLILKLLTHCHPFSLGVWTFLLMSFFSLLALIYEAKVKKNDKIFEKFKTTQSSGDDWSAGMFYLYLCARAFFGSSALILFFYAVKYLEGADALVIDSASPVFVYIMAYLILKEEMGIFPVFAAILAMIGVGCIARPPLFTGNESEYNLQTLVGVTLAFLAMLCISINVIVLKFLESIHFSLVNLIFGVWGMIQCFLMSLFTEVLSVPSEFNDVLLIVGSAVLFFTGQVLMTLALQFEDAGPVGLLRTSEVIFIFLWQYLFLGVIPDIFSYVGASLVLFGVVLTVLRKWIGTLPSSSNVRNSPLKYLLH